MPTATAISKTHAPHKKATRTIKVVKVQHVCELCGDTGTRIVNINGHDKLIKCDHKMIGD